MEFRKDNMSNYCKNCYELQEQLDQLKATNEDLLSIQYKLADNNKRLRQSLAEIKEIADSVTDNGSLCIICEVNKNCADCLDEKLQDILQKISESEVTNDN